MTTTRSGPPSGGSTATEGVWTLRRLGAALVVALLAQILLGVANALWLTVPETGDAWSASAPQSLVDAHMVVGIALIVLSAWVAVRAVRGQERSWIIASVIGVVGILAGLLGGVMFMNANGSNGASMVMAVGCVIATTGYVFALAER